MRQRTSRVLASIARRRRRAADRCHFRHRNRPAAAAPILRRAAGEIVLGEVGPVDRRRGIVLSMTMLPPKPRRRSISAAAKPAAPPPTMTIFRALRLRRHGARFRLLALLRDEDPAVALLDRPAVDRAQGRCAHGLAGAQIEAGVMPGAANAVADDEASASGHGSGCNGRRRRTFAAAAHQQNLLVADMPDKLAVGEIGEAQRLGQVRAVGGACSCAMGVSSVGARPAGTRLRHSSHHPRADRAAIRRWSP